MTMVLITMLVMTVVVVVEMKTVKHSFRLVLGSFGGYVATSN